MNNHIAFDFGDIDHMEHNTPMDNAELIAELERIVSALEAREAKRRA